MDCTWSLIRFSFDISLSLLCLSVIYLASGLSVAFGHVSSIVLWCLILLTCQMLVIVQCLLSPYRFVSIHCRWLMLVLERWRTCTQCKPHSSYPYTLICTLQGTSVVKVHYLTCGYGHAVPPPSYQHSLQLQRTVHLLEADQCSLGLGRFSARSARVQE